VALFIEDPVLMTAAILGVLKAGKVFVPLDPNYPTERNAFMIQDCGTTLVVCDQSTVALSTARNVADQCQILELGKLAPGKSVENPAVSTRLDEFAYVMYTSGSTGKPKGVIGGRKTILYDILWMTNTLGICRQDRLTLLHSLSFSGATYNFFGALLNGATLVPFEVRDGSYSELVRWMHAERITIFHSVPAVFRLLCEHLTGTEKFPYLRLVILGGAVVTVGDINRFRKHFPTGCSLLHRMGTTETNTVGSYFVDHDLRITGNKVPLGWPPEGKEVLILDEAGQSLPFDQVGEIAVRSRYLTPGYWNDPELTAAKFLADPEVSDQRVYLTGDLGRMTQELGLVHLGRIDSQVRVRGHRVETAEIEAVLARYPGVKEAVIVARECPEDNAQLIAYVTVEQQATPSLSDLRSLLQNSLPLYMLPSKLIILDSMPMMPNGKVNRRALPDPGETRPELDTTYVAPRSVVETELAQIWTQVLSIDLVGIHDNFLDLGGHSLAASRVISRVIQSFQLELPVKALFDAPTVAEIANIITQNQTKQASNTEMAQMLHEVEAMTEDEAQRQLAKESAQG